ncbi:cation:proton antiporter [Roseomonas marmotae]|uniref:Cation:proton antiporter n=1 Tax=Roseomonas marmotae TaxID=2768161 RepID=A0ABS3KCB0_9PROT|nr:cation:proton antiporter [Roseomonas marmotae]MBO1075113.1 cation:proton antiporter [Roseomonas marmotae]QTI79772.1 cation:proton antiporter [Roseomonas marmotae]
MLNRLPDTILATALMLIVISAIQPLARKMKLSSTVLLAGVGVLLAGGGAVVLNNSNNPFIDEAAQSLLHFPIDSDAFLYIFLPLLVFQGSLSIDVRRLARDWAPVLMMAVVAVVVTTAAIGFALAPISGASLVVCLMLGAIVATTDPSAVVGIFHEVGANSRLTRLVEGESLLNDAAAISIFTLMLAQITGQQSLALSDAVSIFFVSFLGGILAGIVAARLMLLAIPWLGGNRTAEVTLTLALPYLTYIVCEQFLDVSGVVAAAVAGLTVSAKGPSIFRPQSWHFLQEVWDQLSFWASSLVFVLASMLVPKLLLGATGWDLVLVGVMVVAALVARAIVLFGLLPVLEYTHLSQRVSTPAKVTMLWGGLRGAITLAMALSVTEHDAVPEQIQRFVAILATGYVLFTLLVNGTTLRFLVRWLKLNQLSASDDALRNQVVAIGLGEVRDRLRDTAAELGISSHATGYVLESYERRVKEETAANTFDTAIGDRERVTLGLITYASQERSVLLEMFENRTLSRRVMENLLRTAESMIDGARNEGRHGYIQAARRRLQPTLRFNLARWLHHRFRIDRPLTHSMAERFETLLLTHLVSMSMSRFMRQRMEPVLGQRVTEVVAGIVARRQDMLQDALDVLRLQYPGYSEALESRLLRQIGLRMESEEYSSLRQESLIGQELEDDLLRGMEQLRRQIARPLQFNIQSGIELRLKEFKAFSGLSEALLYELAMKVTTRFAVPEEVIYRKGQWARSAFLISRGEVSLKEDASGTEEVVLGAGEIFGETELLANRHRRGASAHATSFCHLLELDKADFQSLLHEAPELRQQMERIAAQRSRSSTPDPASPPKGSEAAEPVPLPSLKITPKPATK